jgi:hypothetical protein
MLQTVESLRHITKHCLKTTGDRRSIKKPISLTFEGMDMVSGGDNKTSDGILTSAHLREVGLVRGSHQKREGCQRLFCSQSSDKILYSLLILDETDRSRLEGIIWACWKATIIIIHL